MKMEHNHKEKTTRTDLNDDDLERSTDNTMEWIDTRRGALTLPLRAMGTPPNGGTNIETANPFKPRASLSRSPAGRTVGVGNTEEKGEEEEIFEIEDSPKPGEVENRKPAEQKDGAEQAEGVLFAHDILQRMITNAREATKAVNAIYQYAATTKNVNRILKGKSGNALNYLESLSKEMEEAYRHGKRKTGLVIKRSDIQNETVSTASQTETPSGVGDTNPIAGGPGEASRKLREEVAPEANEHTPTTGRAAILGGRDKRKEISPPELAKAKRNRPNARGTGNAILSARWVNEPLRERPRGPDETAMTDPKSIRTRFSSDNLGELESETGAPPSPTRRKPRQRPAPIDKWDYVTGAPKGRRTPKRSSYAEVVRDNLEGPHGKAYRSSLETTYLRKARIPHWEWCDYSSQEPSDEESEGIPNRGIGVTGRLPFIAPRINDRLTSTARKRQETSNMDPTRKVKRRRKRIKPEAVLVRIEPGGSYLETYKAISGELKTHIKGVKGVRKTKTGQMLIEIGPEVKAEEVRNSVRKGLGEGVQVRVLQETMTLQLRGLDPIISKEEVATDMAEAGGIDPADVTVQTLRPMKDGTQAAIVKIPARKVNGELRSGRIKIGLVICRARILPEITRCFRCHQNGHVGAECKNLEVGKSLCRRCGQEDHSMESCERSPRCVLCANTGLEGTNVRHVAGALNCPAFRGNIRKPKYG